MMNIKMIVVALVIGVLLWQIDAARSKSNRKKTVDRGNTSEFTSSSSGFAENDDEDRQRKDKSHGYEREYKVGQKKDRKHSSSSSEEDDKDGKNETAINLSNKIHRKRESKFKEHSSMLPWMKHDIHPGLAPVESNLKAVEQNEGKLLTFSAESHEETLLKKKMIG
ncbi:Uncharacterized protein BM_BM10905 [Brugia malayi]|uniref:Bm10905 n=1 Tax=Brugia malayi TaxID=6279 RepID=A0A0J9Y2F4_BRUMA|nr:Uncharacterized protein BM_BM10905 [Brugia malayi]CDQ00363.1 Bm10905 [Brugia malayi]VIO86187.1 Uncharacterized protein BM_BM10905 [Brugia malayi]